MEQRPAPAHSAPVTEPREAAHSASKGRTSRRKQVAVLEGLLLISRPKRERRGSHRTQKSVHNKRASRARWDGDAVYCKLRRRGDRDGRTGNRPATERFQEIYRSDLVQLTCRKRIGTTDSRDSLWATVRIGVGDQQRFRPIPMGFEVRRLQSTLRSEDKKPQIVCLDSGLRLIRRGDVNLERRRGGLRRRRCRCKVEGEGATARDGWIELPLLPLGGALRGPTTIDLAAIAQAWRRSAGCDQLNCYPGHGRAGCVLARARNGMLSERFDRSFGEIFAERVPRKWVGFSEGRLGHPGDGEAGENAQDRGWNDGSAGESHADSANSECAQLQALCAIRRR